MTVQYSNREIDEKLHSIHEKLDLILSQTTKTNGRVTKLENWRSLLLGGWGMITFLVIPLLTYIYWEHQVRTQDQIDLIINK